MLGSCDRASVEGSTHALVSYESIGLHTLSSESTFISVHVSDAYIFFLLVCATSEKGKP